MTDYEELAEYNKRARAKLKYDDCVDTYVYIDDGSDKLHDYKNKNIPFHSLAMPRNKQEEKIFWKRFYDEYGWKLRAMFETTPKEIADIIYHCDEDGFYHLGEEEN